VPAIQNVGGGGTNTLRGEFMLRMGAIPYISTAQSHADGYLFIGKDAGALPWGPGEEAGSYVPGIGSGLKANLLSLAPLALPFIVSALVPATAAVTTSGGAAAAGTIMPGAAAVSSGATGGILATASVPVVTSGAGLTATGVIGAAKTAAGVISAVSTVQKLVTSAQQKTITANALQDSAAEQARAGNLIAAQQLESQANAYQGAALESQQRAALVAQAGGLSWSSPSIPLWAMIGAGGALLLFFLSRRSRP
ncbi:MAG: hypothetical protein ACREUY_10725, partial [Burkholderiales bacterium]